MVVKVVDKRGTRPETPERMAGPGEARSIAALFLAAGAAPNEIDGAVQVQIEQSVGRMAPRSYEEVAQSVLDALKEYRNRVRDSIPEIRIEHHQV